MIPDPRQWAESWIQAWNKHDLDAIVAHYADNIEFTSPFVRKLLNSDEGCVRGKAALRDYFARGLERFPALQFELTAVLSGVRSVLVCYNSVGGLKAAEYFEFDDASRVRRVSCHYVDGKTPI